MATIRKRGARWQVQIRRHNTHTHSKSFLSRNEALQWARAREIAIDRGEITSETSPAQEPLRDLLARYETHITSRKRSKESEHFHLRQIARSSFTALPAAHITPKLIAAWRDARLQSVSSSTVRKELMLLGSIFSVAIAEWGVKIKNPVRLVKKPSLGKARERRLEADEKERLFAALLRCRNPEVGAIVQLSMATGMRRGELLSLTWGHIDLLSKTAFLPKTKNGEPRLVPLSPFALIILHDLKSSRRASLPSSPEDQLPKNEPLFSVSANALRLAWERAKRRAGVHDFRFHDLRHEAISTFFEIGLSVPEVALISGHKDPRMLFRYTHLKARDLAQKLTQLAIPSEEGFAG